ncbi:tetratricopeptide repeat protein, partial [bacterium]
TRAIEASTAGLKIDPKIAELYNIRGNNYMAQGNYQKAVADYVAAGKLDPGYSAGLYGRSFFGRTEEWNKAIASFSAAVARSPRSAAAYFNRAVIYADMSVWDKAIADYSQAIRLDPKLANAYYLRGVAQFQMATDFDVRSYKNKMTDAKRRSVFYRATADYGTAIRLDPKFASAYYQRAVALEELTKDAAVRDYSTFIQLNPAYSGHAHYKRGEIYQGRKEWDKVIADFKAYRQLPRPISTKSMVYYMDSSAPHRIADAYMEKGDISRGIAMYDEAMNVPGEGRYSNLRDRGLAYVLKGDIPKAMADLNAAVLLRPNYADAYTSRAKAYRKLGQVERAGLDEQMAAVLSPKK